MKQNRLASIILVSSILLLASCGATKYYYSEGVNRTQPEIETCIELQLHKNGTFDEYVYFVLNDTIDNVNEGRLISGTYTSRNDTLFLMYHDKDKVHSADDSTDYHEIYLVEEERLILLAPITYSYHFLNQTLVPGKSKRIRVLPFYESIKWVKQEN